MKVLGAMLYIVGFLGIAFVITETRIDLGGSFEGILLLMLWMFITMGLGTILMRNGDDSDEK